MIFIPEEWERIRYRIEPGIHRVVTIGRMIDERYSADLKIGFAKDGLLYSIESEDETEDVIRRYPVYQYGRIATNIPSFVVRTSYETVSYKIYSTSSEIWLTFTDNYIKESNTIWYELKEYVTELKLGDPSDIISTLTEEEKIKEQDEDIGWTAWVGDWVLFPLVYDSCYFSIGHAPRNPCDKKTGPLGDN